jgi:hypothetical protein
MKFTLAQYLSEDITSRSGIITNLSNDISNFLRGREYGGGLQEIVIGIICVRPEFEQFFPVDKPKYTKAKEILKVDIEVVVERTFEYRIKVDYSTFKDAFDIAARKILSQEILKSLDVFTTSSVKDFDVDKFKTDFEEYLRKQPLL